MAGAVAPIADGRAVALAATAIAAALGLVVAIEDAIEESQASA